MSSDQENFLLSHTNAAFGMQNIDQFYKMMNFFKFFLNGANEPKQDFLNMFLYQCQQQIPSHLYAAAVEKHQPENFLQESCNKTLQTNRTDLLREAIEKIISSNENKSIMKQKSRSECTGNENLKQHMKQTNFRRSFTGSNEAIPTHKMVRGQEEWVNNSRNNNFISQILKCLECSASFDTLDDLSLHMLKYNHFSRFHPNQALQSSRPISPKQKAKMTLSVCKMPKNMVNSANVDLTTAKNLVSPRAPSDTSFPCKICKKNLQEQSSLPPLIELIQHLKKNHQIDFICTNCGEFFYSERDLNEHLIEFHQFGNVHQKKTRTENERKETKTMSTCPSPTADPKEKPSHPLLALQMFVNGASELDTSIVSKAKGQISDDNLPPKTVPKQNLDAKSKLPAKKRPYLKEEEKSEENEVAEAKRLKSDEEARESCNDMHPNLTQNRNTYQPLNLLQNMRLNIDEYFSH